MCQFDAMSPRKTLWPLCQEELGLPKAIRPSLRDSKIAAVTTATAAALATSPPFSRRTLPLPFGRVYGDPDQSEIAL